jgi:lipopolysaccharide export system permease protein
MQFVARNNAASILLQEGAFTQVVNGVTAYVRERTDEGELNGLLLHDGREPLRPITVIAERGTLIVTSEGPRFVLVNGHRQELDRSRGQLTLLYFDEYAFDVGGFAVAPETRWREGSERFLHELLSPGDGLDDVKNRDRFFIEAHRRLTLPLYPLALVAMALAALVAGEFSRRNRWARVAVAGAVAILFELVGLALLPILGRSTYLLPLLYLHGLAAIAAGLYLATRHRHVGSSIQAMPKAA